MSKISDLKMEYNERLDCIPPALEEEKLQEVLKLIETHQDLAYYIKRQILVYMVHGMSLACNILFDEESVNQL